VWNCRESGRNCRPTPSPVEARLSPKCPRRRRLTPTRRR
jgi:hypothetical protein